MIGCKTNQEAIFIFLESNDVAYLRQGKINGTVVNLEAENLGKLELIADSDKLKDSQEKVLVETKLKNGLIARMNVYIKSSDYYTLATNGELSYEEPRVLIVTLDKMSVAERKAYETLSSRRTVLT